MLRWQTFGGLTDTDHRRTLLRPTKPATNEMDGSCTPKARYRDVIAPAPVASCEYALPRHRELRDRKTQRRRKHDLAGRLVEIGL